ncbi:MAG: hypothetical protein M3Q65_02590 [Chloroflexota bacterium]|nr:hypothetical protein [Chloroflexota bacterium]
MVILSPTSSPVRVRSSGWASSETLTASAPLDIQRADPMATGTPPAEAKRE